jgi:hypothetical protein
VIRERRELLPPVIVRLDDLGNANGALSLPGIGKLHDEDVGVAECEQRPRSRYGDDSGDDDEFSTSETHCDSPEVGKQIDRMLMNMLGVALYR